MITMVTDMSVGKKCRMNTGRHISSRRNSNKYENRVYEYVLSSRI